MPLAIQKEYFRYWEYSTEGKLPICLPLHLAVCNAFGIPDGYTTSIILSAVENFAMSYIPQGKIAISQPYFILDHLFPLYFNLFLSNVTQYSVLYEDSHKHCVAFFTLYAVFNLKENFLFLSL